jgi:hypothetical protein
MTPDIAKAGRPEKRITNRMQQHVTVGVRGQALRKRDADTAEHHMVAVFESVCVDTLAYAHD